MVFKDKPVFAEKMSSPVIWYGNISFFFFFFLYFVLGKHDYCYLSKLPLFLPWGENWIKRSKIKINNSILFQFKFWKIMWLWLHCADLK